MLYMSRVPPFMNPAKVKSLLSHFGEVTKIYLAEEDASVKKKRGPRKQKNFVEGWIEFASKRIAKDVAASLNNTPIGKVKKREYYAHDLWNLKYLRGFSWHQLTEKIAYERRTRGQQLRMEVANANRVNAEYVKQVEQRKAIAAIQSRKREKGGGEGEDKQHFKERTFKQRRVAGNNNRNSSQSSAAALEPATERCLLEI